MKASLREIAGDWIDRKIDHYPHLAEAREDLIDACTQKLEEANYQQILDDSSEAEGRLVVQLMLDRQFGNIFG